MVLQGSVTLDLLTNKIAESLFKDNLNHLKSNRAALIKGLNTLDEENRVLKKSLSLSSLKLVEGGLKKKQKAAYSGRIKRQIHDLQKRRELVKNALGRLNKIQKSKNTELNASLNGLPKCFMACAKLTLSDTLFTEIKEQAKSLVFRKNESSLKQH